VLDGAVKVDMKKVKAGVATDARLYHGQPLTPFSNAPAPIHPTVSELIPTMLGELRSVNAASL